VADYAIGDLQGCYDPFMRLLEQIDFNDRDDQLWLVGDLVNRGPQSLAVLRFLYALPKPAIITLGNHDLHLLSALFGGRPWKGHDDTIEEVLQADDGEELGHWLRRQPLIYYSAELNYVMTHAGIAPMWNLEQALMLGQELQQVLAGEQYRTLPCLYGNLACWTADLQGVDRLRVLTNYFTRMRWCDAKGCLELKNKKPAANQESHLYPWYQVPGRQEIAADILFGHWAALRGHCPHPRIHALDTGCFWGHELTALRLQDKHRFSVPGIKS